MILEKFGRISKLTGQVTARKLDLFSKTTSISHKVCNPNYSCKRKFASYTYNQIRCLNAFSDLRYTQVEVKPSSTKTLFHQQQPGGIQLLESSEAYVDSVPKRIEFNESLVVDNLEELLNKSWISMSNSEIIENFEYLSHYAFKHEETIHNEKFSGVLEVLKSRCIDFSDSDIRHIFKCLQLWKIEKEQEAFTELWKTFEAEILKRYSNWTIDEILLTCHLYYKLKISRLSDFTFYSLKKIGRKPQNMNHTQLISFTFLMKMNRKLPINLYNIEYYVEKQVDRLSIRELGIFTLAFNQYETPIRSPVFIEKIIDKLIDGIDTLDQMSLNCLLTSIRVHRSTLEKYMNLLKKLEEISSHISLHTLSIVALMQKKSLIHSESLMSKILERCEAEVTNLNIKQIDNVMFTLMTLGYDSKTTPFVSIAIRELMESKRASEIEKFPKTIISIAHCALLMNYLSEDLCSKIFNVEFIDKFCKNDYYNLNREYLEMSYCLELDHPEYNGPKLDKQVIDFLCKYLGSYKNENTVRRSEKNTMDGKLLSDIERICTQALKSKSAFYRETVLPHCSKAFGIICYDPETKEFGSPKEKLSEIPWNLSKYAPADGRKWFALVTGSIYQIINNTRKPVGKVLMQMRHLEKIGYKPIFIPHCEWENLSNDSAEKEKYILDILHG